MIHSHHEHIPAFGKSLDFGPFWVEDVSIKLVKERLDKLEATT